MISIGLLASVRDVGVEALTLPASARQWIEKNCVSLRFDLRICTSHFGSGCHKILETWGQPLG